MTIVNNLTQFTPDTKALSSEVNANFEIVRTAHNDTENKLSTLQSLFNTLNSKAVLEDGTNVYTADQSLGGFKLTNLAEPVNEQDAATKKYVLNSLSGFKEYGCNISNNSVNPNTQVDITIGQYWDSTYMSKITLSTALTKRLDASWAAGNAQGGLDTGSPANSTDYYIFIISKADNTPDVLFSASSSIPLMPSGYIFKKLIGIFRTDSGGHIIPAVYTRHNNLLRVEYKSLITETTTITSTPTDLILTVPDLPNCRVKLNCLIRGGGTNKILYLKDLVTNVSRGVAQYDSDDFAYARGIGEPVINVSAKKIQYYFDSASTVDLLEIKTTGYEVIL